MAGGSPGTGTRLHRDLLGLLALCPGQISLIRLEQWIKQALLSQEEQQSLPLSGPVIGRGRSPIPALPQGWKEHFALSSVLLSFKVTAGVRGRLWEGGRARLQLEIVKLNINWEI